jgi:uncharacterized membrane protein YgdD (TMEM256/DUF423 family)
MSDFETPPLPRRTVALCALLGFACVAGGAFAAHAIEAAKAQEWLRTGSLYGFVHVLAALAAVLLARLGLRGAGRACGPFLAGVAIFAGSLFAMAFGAPRWLGAATPVGGLAFLVGWAMLAWAGLRAR